MKKFLVFLLFVSLFLAVLPRITHAEPISEPVATNTYRWVEPGTIVSADTFRCDPSCNNQLEQLCDDSETTYQRFIVNQRVYLHFKWGGTLWSNCTVADVDASVLREHPNWTLDRKTTEWPRGSSGGNYPPQQPANENWPTYQWKQLMVNQFLVIPSGLVYYNFTSESQNTNSINIVKNTTIVSTQTVWIWVTTSARLYTTDPGYEKITLSPGSNTQPQEEDGWLYSNIPAHGYATGWLEAFINGSWVDMKQSCLNGLVVENNSNNQIQIRYKKADPNDPKDRRLVTVYSSGNSLESIKTHYANVLGVPVNHLSFRQIFLSPN